jgi:AcrR family transcriptional regulator
MGRHKKVSDEAVLESALGVLAQGGREHFTLARAALAAGVAVPTLLQRFGSRAGLLAAAAAYANGWLKAWLEARSGADTASLLGELSPGFGDRRRFGDHVSFLREDVSDPAFAVLARERLAMVRAAIAERLNGFTVDRAATAELIEAQWHGAVLQWSIHPQGALSTYVERSVRELMRRIGA